MQVIGTELNFAEETKEGLVLVDFFATWCGPCRMLEPVLENLINDNPDIKLVKVDVDQNRNLAMDYNVFSVPTLVLFKDGKLVDTKTGYLPKEILESWIRNN